MVDSELQHEYTEKMKVKVLIRRDFDYICVLGVFTDDKKLEYCIKCDEENEVPGVYEGPPVYEIEEYELNDTGWEEEKN